MEQSPLYLYTFFKVLRIYPIGALLHYGYELSISFLFGPDVIGRIVFVYKKLWLYPENRKIFLAWRIFGKSQRMISHPFLALS